MTKEETRTERLGLGSIGEGIMTRKKRQNQVVLTVRIPPVLRDKLILLSENRGVGISEYVRWALTEYVQYTEYEKERKKKAAL